MPGVDTPNALDEAALDRTERVGVDLLGGKAHRRGFPGLASMLRLSYISVKTEMSDGWSGQ